MHERGLLREPIVHFLLLGIVLFAGYAFVAPADPADERIVVTRAAVDDLERQFRSRWNRPPTDAEREQLVEAYVRDEILYREGVSLGLDRDDPVIKRRVRQKFELVAEEAIPADAPTDEQLATFLNEHSDRFLRPPRVSFEQVSFDVGLPPAELDDAVAAALEALARGADPMTLGVRTLLPHRIDGLSLDLVARDFGAAFAQRLQAGEVGRWSGPIRSGFGVHLVRVAALAPAELPPLETVRAAVAREWELERRTRSAQDGYRRLRARYVVEIEPTRPAPDGGTP